MSVPLAALNAKGHTHSGCYLEFARKEGLVQQTYILSFAYASVLQTVMSHHECHDWHHELSKIVILAPL